MATSNSKPPSQSSSRGPLIIMAAAVIAIAALVGWALTRTVEPIPSVAPEVTASTPMPPPVAATSGTVTQTTASIPPGPPAGQDTVPRISIADMKNVVGRPDVTVIDVRDADAYTMSHIPGAIHIPLARIEGEADALLPRNRRIITYCT